jgi:hypothetical protein
VLDALRLLGVVLTGLALVPAGAHLAEMPNKLPLAREQYLVAQQLYWGWAWWGIVILGALVATLALAIEVRRDRRAFVPALVAFLCIAGTQAIFWIFTFPVNQATANWTMLPENWTALRRQWEYSHAASAVLNLIAFVSVTLAAIRAERLKPHAHHLHH